MKDLQEAVRKGYVLDYRQVCADAEGEPLLALMGVTGGVGAGGDGGEDRTSCEDRVDEGRGRGVGRARGKRCCIIKRREVILARGRDA